MSFASSRNSRSKNGSRTAWLEVETWLPKDLRPDGKIVRADVAHVVAVNLARNEVILANGGGRLCARNARPIASQGKEEEGTRLPPYVDRHSLVEVWIDEEWFLAEVVGFKQREDLLVEFLVDGTKDWVKKADARWPSEMKPFQSAQSLLDINSALDVEDSEEEEDEGEEELLSQEPKVNDACNNNVDKLIEEFKEKNLIQEMETLSVNYLKKDADTEAALMAIQSGLEQKMIEKADIEQKLHRIFEECRTLQARQLQLDFVRQVDDRVHEQVLRWMRKRSDWYFEEKERHEVCSVCKRQMTWGMEEFIFACARGHALCGPCHSQTSVCVVCSIKLQWARPFSLYTPYFTQPIHINGPSIGLPQVPIAPMFPQHSPHTNQPMRHVFYQPQYQQQS